MSQQPMTGRLEIGYFDDRAAKRSAVALASLDRVGMTLMVREDGERVVYHGERRGQGHYLLRAAETGAEATLHRFADSTILEGFWRKGRERGFWRLHLSLSAPLELAEGRPRPRRPKSAVRPPARKRLRVAA